MSFRWLIIGAAVLLAVLGLAWLLPREGSGWGRPGSQATEAEPASADSESVSYAQATRGSDGKASWHNGMPEWWRRRFSPQSNQDITLAQAEQFLAAHGRTAPNLLAAFWTTRHASFAEEILAMHAEDPTVIMQTLYLDNAPVIEGPGGSKPAFRLDPDQREELLARMEALDPDNAAVRQLRIMDRAKAGDFAAAMELMQATPGSLPWREYDQPVRKAIVQLFVDTGLDPLAARWRAQHQMNDVVLAQPQYADFEALAEITVEDHVPEDLRQAWAEALYAYAEGWAERPPRRVVDLVAANSTQGAASEALEQVGAPGAADALAHVQERTQRFENIQLRTSLCVRYMTEAEVEAFVDRLTADGQVKAWQWMMETIGPRIPPEVIQAEELRRRRMRGAPV